MAKKEPQGFDVFEYYETNTHNEQLILASLFKSKKMRERILKVVNAKDFIGKRHRLMFEIMLKMEGDGLEFQIDTLVQLAGDKDIGGKAYIKKLLKAYEKNANIDFHIKQLKDDRLKFDLLRGPLITMVEAASSRGAKSEELLKISARISEMVSKSTESERVLLGDEMGNVYVNDFDLRINAPFYGTGLREIDAVLTEGFVPGTISVCAGRPQMGKTIFMANIISNLMRSKRMLVCEIEQGTLVLLDMLVSLHTGISIGNLVKFPHKLTEKEKKRVRIKARQLVKNENVHFLDDPELTLERLAIELKNGNYDICFVDLFGRLADVSPTPDGYTKKLYQAKRIARNTKTHLFFIHQMRRTKDKDRDPRPSVEKLKDSGAWEEVGDLIFGVHREKQYRPQLKKDVIEIVVLKQKRGESNVSVPFKFNGSICEIGDYVKDYIFGRDLREF